MWPVPGYGNGASVGVSWAVGLLEAIDTAVDKLYRISVGSYMGLAFKVFVASSAGLRILFLKGEFSRADSELYAFRYY